MNIFIWIYFDNATREKNSPQNSEFNFCFEKYTFFNYFNDTSAKPPR